MVDLILIQTTIHYNQSSGAEPLVHEPQPAHDGLFFSPKTSIRKHQKYDVRNYVPCKLLIFCLV